MLAAIHDQDAITFLIIWGGLGFVALTVVSYLIHDALSRPSSETDALCSRIDVELDEIRAQGSVRHYTGSGWRN